MSEHDLNFDLGDKSEPSGSGAGLPVGVFRFDPRSLAIYVGLRWKIVLGVFLASVVVFWGIFKYRSAYSMASWTAHAKVFHQTRSDRLPSFYKPVDTQTVLQFIGSKDVLNRVAARLGPDAPEGFAGYVEISTAKGNNNIISVASSARTRESAAAIANAIAEEGVAEYIKRQNNTIRSQLDERMKRRAEINKEILAFDHRMEALNSDASGLPPDLELNKMREAIAAQMTGRTTLQAQFDALKVRLAEVESALKQTPRDVEFETVIDNTSRVTVAGKKSELEALRRRYTDANPKVRALIEEVARLDQEAAKDKEQQPPTKVTYRKNEVYRLLEEQMASLRIDLITVEAQLRQTDTRIEEIKARIAELMGRYNQYVDMKRQQDALRDNVTKLTTSINDLEFLIGSAVPDVSVFEVAKPGAAMSTDSSLLKVLGLAFFMAALSVFCIAARQLSRLKIMASKEFTLSFDIADLGELPLHGEVQDQVRVSVLQMASRDLRAFSAGRQRLAVFKFDDRGAVDADIDEMLQFSSLNGLKSFRLRILPGSKRLETNEAPPFAGDVVAGKLISVAKTADAGVFYYQNDYCLEVPERDLLKFDLEVLVGHYDIVTLEVECGENSDYLASQLSAFSDYAMFCARFDATGKLALSRHTRRIREGEGVKMGGLLFDVPKPYYRT